MHRLPLAVLVVGALVLPACGDDAATSARTPSSAGPTSAGPTSAPNPTAAATSGPADPEVPEALDFRSPTVSDGDLDLATFAGRPVAFWFWAPG